MAKAPKKPRKKANGYQMPEPLPHGEVLTDSGGRNSWKLGSSIGKGGFGEIYMAQDASSKSSKYPFVVKVEPHGNGPLFVEMHFYMRNAKRADIEEFMKKHKLKTFGMPVFLGSGLHESGAMKYRFIVMDKFGTDIDKLRAENKGMLPLTTVFQLAWQITYVLEYIHDLGYVHADIKGGNVLLGITTEAKNQSYLVDFGLATKYKTEKEFKPNPKKAHDGTIEYLSRDAHQGVPTRRGDFEILGYNVIHWLGGTLPWMSKLDDPKTVQQMKDDSMADIPKFVKACLKKNNETIVKFLQYINQLKFSDKPDYKKIRSLFEQEVKKNGASVDGPLELNSTARKRRSSGVSVPDESKTDGDSEVKKPATKRGKKQRESEESDDGGEVMNDAMKEIANKKAEAKKLERKKKNKDNGEPSAKEEVMTDAMKEVLARKQEKEGAKKKKPAPKKEKVNGASKVGDFDGYTLEMIEVKMKKMANAKSSPPSSEGGEGGRPKRNVPTFNYDERTSRISKRKH